MGVGEDRQTMVIVDRELLITGLYSVCRSTCRDGVCGREDVRSETRPIRKSSITNYSLLYRTLVIEKFIMTISRHHGLLILSN